MRDHAVWTAQGADGDFVVEQRAVPAVVAQRDRDALTLLQRLAEVTQVRLSVIVALQEATIAPEDVRGRLAGELLEGRVNVDDRVINLQGIGDDRADRGRLDDLTQQLQVRRRRSRKR